MGKTQRHRQEILIGSGAETDALDFQALLEALGDALDHVRDQAAGEPVQGPVLGIDGTRFTLDGQPTFLIGILLILIFAVGLGWFPSFGRGEVVNLGWWSTGLLTSKGWHHIVLPAITLAIFQLTLIMRLVRAEMLEVLRTDYIKFARARGLSNRAIHFGHALKNTLVPVLTITGLQLGGLIAFAIITETVFQWPGMGLLFIQAVTFADIPVMAAYLCLIALIFVVINLVVDLLYFAVDPRLRVGKAGGH